MRNKKAQYSLIFLLTVLISFLFYTNTPTFAQGAPQRATFAEYEGSIRVYPNGKTPTKSPEEYKELKSNGNKRDQLWIAGDSRSWAHLQFWRQNQRIDPLLKVGEKNTTTKYTFPCRFSDLGSTTIAWGLDPLGSGSCERFAVALNNNNTRNASKQDSPEKDDIVSIFTIDRTEETTLILAYQNNNDFFVDSLVGEVKVTSPSGSVFDIVAGNRYVYSDGAERLDSIDVKEILTSPSMESFLDEKNWSPDVEQLLNKLNTVSSSTISLNEEAQEILDAHNSLRAEVNVPPLSWSPQLASYAQEWADQLSRENSNIRHRDGGASGAGENIAAGNSIGLMLSLWSREKSDYNPATGQCRRGEVCGHYTQMVWRNTTEIGCGVASHRTYGKVMVCNYQPPGNYRGQKPF